MFKLMKEAAYWWPVTIKRPSQERPGELDEDVIRVRYRYLKQTQHDALMEELKQSREAGAPIDDKQFAKRVVLELADIVDDDGQPMAYTPELFELVLNEPGETPAATAITKAYFDSRAGVLEKN